MSRRGLPPVDPSLLIEDDLNILRREKVPNITMRVAAQDLIRQMEDFRDSDTGEWMSDRELIEFNGCISLVEGLMYEYADGE